MSIFSFFESLVSHIDSPKSANEKGPPPGLLAFYWHFVKQTKWLYFAMLLTGLFVALIDTLIPIFIGRLVGLMSVTDRAAAIANELPVLIAMGALLLVGRPAAQMLDSLVRNNAVIPGVTTLIRWQSHWHVLRQSWSFFQDDFAGRIANRVMNTSNALRESVVSSIRAVWYILVYGVSALVLMFATDARLALPTLAWIIGYLFFLWYFVPRMRDLSKASSEARSAVMGRIVDSYTNILTVKLFARAKDEDAYVRDSLLDHQSKISAHMRLITKFMLVLTIMNATLLVSTAAIGVWSWMNGSVTAAIVATALPLVWQISNMAGWVSWEVTGIFENVGVVQEGMETIAVPHKLLDAPNAPAIKVDKARIEFDNVNFSYGLAASGKRSVLENFNLTIAAGERVGVVGRSGAGKSTLVNLLLRFHDVEGGRILIDGQDVREVSQESLRSVIGMVTQDTSLLHRSIASNIRYGQPDAELSDIKRAAGQAQADEFIENLRDWQGKEGYEARAGERGVKLSGGQRQRVALARVLLKNAPILILDEATSALDSEVEAAIQDQLESLMQGKTVIAIAHRLSTIARMDRLVVMDQGQIVEHGTHAELIATNGLYASLWQRQSGGFIAP
jgi:ATP-binding cassette, subfamily B, multidrug efflux pump